MKNANGECEWVKQKMKRKKNFVNERCKFVP